MKLSKEQKDKIMLAYTAQRYFEISQEQSRKKAEKEFVKTLIEILELDK